MGIGTDVIARLTCCAMLWLVPGHSALADDAPRVYDAAGAESLKVYEHHMQAVATLDVEQILEDYADDATVASTLADKPVTGKAGIREAYQRFLQMPNFHVRDPRSRIIKYDAIGEYLYSVFDSDDAGMHGTETYVIRGGKIVFQTITVRLTPPRKRVAGASPSSRAKS